MYFMYPGPNTETRTGYAQNTYTEYSILKERYTQRVHQDTSGYNLREPPHFQENPPLPPNRDL